MTQLEKVAQNLHLIMFGFMKLNNTLQSIHSIDSDDRLIINLQNDQIDLFNEFTIKIQELREEFLENLDSVGMLLGEDYDYIESINKLIE